jgi:hypothetical protein
MLQVGAAGARGGGGGEAEERLELDHGQKITNPLYFAVVNRQRTYIVQWIIVKK